MSASPAQLAALVYDLDGTLIDSAETSFLCYRETFAALGVGFDRQRFEATYAPDWYATYRALGLPEELWAEADRKWLACYARCSSRLLPGVDAALRRASRRGVRQALVTSGSRDRVGRELERHGLTELLAPVICGDDVQNKKPHPEGLLEALGRLDVDPAAAAYLGDSPEDVQMAVRAGVRAVAIPGGFPNRAALLASPYDELAESVPEAVERLVARG